MYAPTTPDERERIIAELKAGKSQNAVAREFGRAPITVCRIAKRAGLSYDAPKNAAACLVDYTTAKRIELGNKLFRHVEKWAARDDLPTNHLRDIIMAYAILTDKRRLEDGEATTRTESLGGDDIRSDIASRLDELASRRRAKTGTG